ncbi:hypothetical protein OAM99_07370, partial [Planktomarina sp.]|nr:hypothetical protein [Planktomarina sp.]
MINKFRLLFNWQVAFTLFLVFLAAVLTLLSTKLVFIKFQQEGLLGLSTAVNIAGIAGILCSLSIESGLIRKIILNSTAKKSFTSLTLAILMLYPFGVTAALVYFIFIEASVTVSIIFALLLYLPFSVLRSYLVAQSLQKFSSLLTLILTTSLLSSVIFSSHPSEILKNMMLSQAILMF